LADHGRKLKVIIRMSPPSPRDRHGKHFERLRESWKPSNVRILFVGESRPRSGRFFYDPEENSTGLSGHTQAAFSLAFRRSFTSKERFLELFKRTGCYLDDLCTEPVNKTAPARRRRKRRAGVASLRLRIERHPPKQVIVVMKGIVRQVAMAAALAGHEKVPIYALPFPTRGRQLDYIEQLTILLRGLGAG
jgi:hypothetical protein